jgi:hypothetical protein
VLLGRMGTPLSCQAVRSSGCFVCNIVMNGAHTTEDREVNLP